MRSHGNAKSPVAIAGGRRAGNPLRAEGPKVGLVAAPIFDVPPAPSAGEKIQRDVEDVIGLVVGQVNFEQWDRSIHFFAQIELLGQLRDGSDRRRRRWPAAYRTISKRSAAA